MNEMQMRGIYKMKKHANHFGKLIIVSLALVLALMLASCSGGSGNSTSEQFPSGGAAPSVGEFKTLDLSGGEITQEVFKDAELTLINFWGTYCPPCIEEMPLLAKLGDEYEGRVQVVGVPIDVDFSKPDSAEYKKALEILDKAGATFKNIQPSGDIVEFLKTMQYVPTSFFVDSEGNPVGDVVIGPDEEKYRSIIETYLADGE